MSLTGLVSAQTGPRGKFVKFKVKILDMTTRWRKCVFLKLNEFFYDKFPCVIIYSCFSKYQSPRAFVIIFYPIFNFRNRHILSNRQGADLILSINSFPVIEPNC